MSSGTARQAVRRLATIHRAPLAVCALFLLVCALTLDNYHHVVDHANQNRIGSAALDYLAGDGERAFDQLVFYHDRYYGPLVEAPIILVQRSLDLRGSAARHSRYLLHHSFFLIGGIFCYLLTYRLFHSRKLALITMILFLLHPRIYVSSILNSKDPVTLALFMVSLYLIHRAFRRETLDAFLLCGIGVGLLVNLRIMGIVLFAAVLSLRVLDLAFAGSVRERKRALLTGGGRRWPPSSRTTPRCPYSGPTPPGASRRCSAPNP